MKAFNLSIIVPIYNELEQIDRLEKIGVVAS